MKEGYEFYIRWCKGCGDKFKTYKKRTKKCPKCFKGLIAQMESIYPEEELNEI